MSDSQAAWTKAFVAAQADMPDIPKGKTATIEMKKGGKFSFAYADLPSIIDAVRGVLAKHDLAVAQSVEATGDWNVAVSTRIYHAAGHVETFGPVVMPSGPDARTAGGAITYARRYALCAALGIAADEDDDAASSDAKRQERREQPPVTAWVDRLLERFGESLVLGAVNHVLRESKRDPVDDPRVMWNAPKEIQDRIEALCEADLQDSGGGGASPDSEPSSDSAPAETPGAVPTGADAGEEPEASPAPQSQEVAGDEPSRAQEGSPPDAGEVAADDPASPPRLEWLRLIYEAKEGNLITLDHIRGVTLHFVAATMIENPNRWKELEGWPDEVLSHVVDKLELRKRLEGVAV